MAASNTKFKVENGLDVVGQANVSGNLKVEGDLAVTGNLAFNLTTSGDIKPTQDDTYAVGNTTNRWLIFSSNGSFNNVSVTSTTTMNNASVANLVPSSNASSIFGSATRLWTVVANTISAVSVKSTSANGITTTATPATFNPNTGIASNTITSAGHGFANNEYVQYIVSAGNTAPTGLTNASSYFVLNANATTFQLSATVGGTAIAITPSTVSETGHTLTPIKVALTQTQMLAPALTANVGALRVYGAATINAGATINGGLTITNVTSTTGNVAVKTSLLFIDTTNNLFGFNNNAPSTVDLITITGNTLFNTANTGLRFGTTNATHNAAITYVASSTSNSRLTFATYDNSNSSVNDGGFLFNTVNSTATTASLFFNSNTFTYKAGNVVHAGNFGIYNVSGTRVGP